MLYAETDRQEILSMRKRRMLFVWLPTAILFLVAVASFVYYRLNHDDGGWVVTGLITILSGAYAIFLYGVYLRPVLKYARHISYMLDGRKRVTTGIIKELSTTVLDRDGIDCYAVMLNVGQKDDPEDDRLFYLDTFKSMDGFQTGDTVTIESNDRMIASIQKA